MARIWNKFIPLDKKLSNKVSLRGRRKVFVAMSGGVDSSVAALMLKRKGYDVTGAHMICWEGCENNQDKQDAMRVAAKLEIPFIVFDFRKEYRHKVYDYMINEYAAGRTPNPDVVCNSEIKFGIFLKRVLEMGADYIATGHYVRGVGDKLRIAKDLNKDQSYFLWKLTPEQISRSLFPIGEYFKREVRQIAKDAGLITAEKKDSQGLCFVGKLDFQEFLREVLPKREGAVVNSKGEVLGQHDGAQFFTLGQRHGLKLGGNLRPLYVAEKNLETNTILAAEGSDDPVLYKKEIEVGDLNLVSDLPEKVLVRIRYRQPLQKAHVHKLSTKIYKLFFDLPERGVASGQSAVFYEGENLLGGGIIKA
ncbi:tRNA 2-thiouridine(34) synthase MnmA [Candidatus Giovannonibacteria bacterium]|nr:tRNA 2-thiouridine(34) synthase MnmA [Candidatus Giovannonibacteria bacterium]